MDLKLINLFMLKGRHDAGEYFPFVPPALVGSFFLGVAIRTLVFYFI